MLIFLYTLSILFMLFIPVALAIALRRKTAVPWWLFCVGILTFAGSQAVHLPLNNWLTDLGMLDMTAENGLPFWRTVVVLGLTAGICEEIARAVGYWLLARRGHGKTAGEGLMAGLGHGGIEAMAFGAVLTAATVTSLLALQGQDLDTLGIPAAQLETVRQQVEMFLTTPLAAVLPAWERLGAIGLHVTLSVMVWLAFDRRNWGYVGLAVLLHALVDSALVALHHFLQNPWLLEVIFTLVVLPGVVAVFKFSRVHAFTSSRERLHTRTPDHLNTFFAALSKEVQQQWRTKRVLIVGAVFLLFGLMSPLLAYATPQLLSSLEGAEQFAALIPTPTAQDAIVQYIKNITQFGFILAVLLGMGAVAGEKEQGTAAMIMSKPLPRWAFLLSKFVAQTAVYLLAFFLSGLGAYIYTWVLFEPLSLGAFVLGNLLLWAWMLTFAAITLLASTIANSTGAAAGLALGGAVLLAILGSLPNIGALFPAGLVAWASGLGVETAVVAANGGALATSGVLIVVCLITAVAVFEVQEL